MVCPDISDCRGSLKLLSLADADLSQPLLCPSLFLWPRWNGVGHAITNIAAKSFLSAILFLSGKYSFLDRNFQVLPRLPFSYVANDTTRVTETTALPAAVRQRGLLKNCPFEFFTYSIIRGPFRTDIASEAAALFLPRRRSACGLAS